MDSNLPCSENDPRARKAAKSSNDLSLYLKNEGLNIGSAEQPHILQNPGDRFSLGDGNAIDFTPVFWVEGNAPVGHYWASFKVVDTNTEGGRQPIPESGIFWIDFQVAPEPELIIERSVSITLPLVTPGYVLESAPTVNGPWTPVLIRHGEHSGNQQTFTVPASDAMRVYRLRKE